MKNLELAIKKLEALRDGAIQVHNNPQAEALDDVLALLDNPVEVQYLIFGELAVSVVQNHGENALLRQSEDFPHALYKWDETSTPENLLSAFEGWLDYAFISKETYEKL